MLKLNKELETLIAEEENTRADPKHLFQRGLGYVELRVEAGMQADTVGRYYMAPSLCGLKKKGPDTLYPLFYSYVACRLVFIYVDELQSAVA